MDFYFGGCCCGFADRGVFPSPLVAAAPAESCQHLPCMGVHSLYLSAKTEPCVQLDGPWKVILLHCSFPVATGRPPIESSEHTIFLEVLMSAVGFCNPSGTAL